MNNQVSKFLRDNFKHFNARETIDAADAYIKVIKDGNKMMVTLASAMSTGEIGISLAEMIRQDKVHAISTTGANLEEDVFNLYGKKYYKQLSNYKDLTKEDEMELRKNGFNRVTDVAFSDKKAIEPVADEIKKLWAKYDKVGVSKFPHEYLYEFLLNDKKKNYSVDPKNSWMLAAAERNLPIVCPGWEDSTLGNNYAAGILRGEIKNRTTVKSGVDYMVWLATWYTVNTKLKKIGFFQIGGGIAGDFPICVVPLLRLDMNQKAAPLWAYFCQITDSTTSYGGYSGALPNEKITWGKLDTNTPSFNIESDASIVAPLIFALVLGL